MKTQVLCLALVASLSWAAYGQEVFIYDQESVSSDYDTGETGFSISTDQPIGQSFMPALSSVGFVRLQMFDLTPYNAVGATVYVNLWSGSLDGGGDLLGSTTPVYLPAGFGGGSSPLSALVNFFFVNPIAVTPSQTYYLQPVIQSGDNFAVTANFFTYSGGSLYVQGTAQLEDLWFREGIVVPEPSPLWVILLGSGVWFCVRNERRFVHSSRRRFP